MEYDNRTGYYLLCCMCSGPWICGMAMGAWLYKRISQAGWMFWAPVRLRAWITEVLSE